MRRVPILFLTITAFSSLLLLGQNELPQFRPAPTRPSPEAEVILEWMEILDECFEDKICVQGHLLNQGKKPANQVKLKIEIGGTKHTRPRIVLHRNVDQPVMQPGDQQDFDLTIDRKVPYKDKGEDKIIEVGKYNFKIVPTWALPSTKKKPSPKKIKPKTPSVSSPKKTTQ